MPPTHRRRALSRSSVTFLWLSVAVLTIAAAQRPTPVIAGVVRDFRGRPVHPVEIVVVTPAGALLKILTAADGSYEVPIRTPGQYDIRLQKPGFTSNRALRFVDGRSRVQHDMVLSIGSLAEELTVTARPGSSGAAARSETTVSPRPCDATAGGSDVLEPRKVVEVRPIYPPDLAADGVSGTVVLRGVVSTQGTIRDVTIIREGHEKLAAAASAAVSQWQYTPTRVNCVPVEVELNVTVNFTTGR